MNLSKKVICVISSSRADYGLLKNIIFEIKKSKKLILKLLVTGTHLSSSHGLTYKEIMNDKIRIDNKIKVLKNSDSELGVSKSLSEGIKKFSYTYNKIKPDLVLVLGDRFEIFSAAIASMLSRIPIAHIHGGESTEGVIDEAIRHSITKMSHLHFVAATPYKKRVIQLGESPKNVYCVGGMGVDTIKKTKFYSKKFLEKKIGFSLNKKNILVNFHPVTIKKNMTRIYISEILKALKLFQDSRIIFTMPNADHESKIIFKEINNFVKKNKNSTVFKSLGSLTYLSCLKFVDIIVGNSSSGLLEAPTLKTPTINIGERQDGRLKAKSITDCPPKKKEIVTNIKKVLRNKGKFNKSYFKSPYGTIGASKKIISILEKKSFNNLLKKTFYDL